MNAMYLIRWKWFCCCCLLLFSICASAQQVDLSLSGEMDCTENSYCVSIGIKSDSDNFEIGTSSIFVDYNEEAIQFASYTSTSFNGVDKCIADVASAWDIQSFDGTSVLGDFNLTMTLLSSAFSCPSIIDTYQEIGVICFDVLDNTIDPSLIINPLNTQFNTALSNDGTNPIKLGATVDITGANNLVCDPCAEKGGDTDGDTVCDANDKCPTGDDRQDADNDGIPDACDTCDTAIAGQVCDDNNACTEGDVYDASCNCVGVIADADSDGVCDADDICPTGDDGLDADNDGIPDACDTCDATLAGQVCDDNNACTEGDIYDADCNCVGVIADADSDGVCDADDKCPTGDDRMDADNDGIPDACDVVQPTIAGIVINEIHYNPSLGDDAEFIELVNTTNAPIELQGLSISEGVSYTFEQPYLLPGTESYPQNYIVLAKDSLTFIATYGFAPYGDYGGKLSNSSELVQLVDVDSIILDEVIYADIAPWDTLPDGGPYSLALIDLDLDNSLAVSWEAQSILVTPGAVNEFGAIGDADGDGVADNLDQCPGVDDSIAGTACDDGNLCTSGETYDASCNCSGGILVDTNNDTVCDFEQRDYGGIVINEIHYNPTAGDDAEFIEIVNTTNAPIDLLGVHFSEGVNFVFEESFLLSGANDYPQNYLVIAKDSAFFTSEYNVPLYGDYSGKLSNGGEAVTLADPLGNIIDEVIYEDGLPWDSIPDNGLHSLALINLIFDNGLPTSWSAQSPELVTPGTINIFDTTNACSDEDNDGICDEADDCDNRKEGTACNDNNPCTEGEVYDNSCNCVGGTLVDSDNDTVCDQDDKCASLDDRLLGTACDDGNPNTGNDIYDLATCSCAGIVGSNMVTRTACIRVADSFDDVEENTTDGIVDFDSGDIELIFNRDYNQVIGLRFGNSEIPQGATILSASVQFTADETSSDPVNLVIKGEATDDAATFALTPYNVSTRAATNASTSWSPQAWITVGDAGAAQRTTDIAAIIQEIVDRPNYQSGNAIALIIEGTGKRTAESFDGSPSQAAELCITYSTEGDDTNGDCTVGASCDDGNPCTIDDYFDADCNCISDALSPDSDNDGICDATDTTIGDCTAGASCDDGDPCTLDDYFDADCNCISDTLSPDSDNDGICDATDTTIGNCTAGVACDDGNPCTIDDYFDADCNCISDTLSPDSDNDGICDATDTTNGDCTAGASCDDGNPCTIDDYFDADCNCISDTRSPDNDNDGVCDAEDQCANLDDKLLGQPCDDGLANTSNDTYDSATCSCAGTPDVEEPVCNVTVSVTGSTINLTGLEGAIVSVKLYDKNFNRINECDTWNNPCFSNEVFSNLPDGQYYLSVGTFDDNWTEMCRIFEEISLPFDGTIGTDSDSDGVLDDEDCQPLNGFFPAIPGTYCDDADPTTSKDVVLEDGCSCAGVVIDNNCNAIYNIDGNKLTVEGLNNDIVSLKILDSRWNTVFECDNWATACGSTEIIDELPDGEYLISISTFTKDWVRLCNVFERISLPSTVNGNTPEDTDGDGVVNDLDCAPFDASLPAMVGSSCDDLDANTKEDVIQEDGCTCSGTLSIDDCNNISISVSQSGVVVAGMEGAPITTLHVYTDEWDLVYSCAGDCQATETVDLPADTYFVFARYYTASWGLICEVDETITVEEVQNFKKNTSSSRNRSADSFQSRAAFIEDITIYPNPASANVFIDFKSYAGQKGILQIHNNLGQVITSERMDLIPSNPFRIDLNNTDAGLHIVSLQLENGTIISKKLMVN